MHFLLFSNMLMHTNQWRKYQKTSILWNLQTNCTLKADMNIVTRKTSISLRNIKARRGMYIMFTLIHPPSNIRLHDCIYTVMCHRQDTLTTNQALSATTYFRHYGCTSWVQLFAYWITDIFTIHMPPILV